MIFVGEGGPASGEVGDFDLFVHEPVHGHPERLDDLARVEGAGLGVYGHHYGRGDELTWHRSRTRIQVVETSHKTSFIEVYPDLFERLATGGVVDALVPRLAAAGLSLAEAAGEGMNTHEAAMFVAGSVSSAVVGYLAVRFLLRFLVNHSLRVFAYYRFALAAVVALALLSSGS